MTTTTQQAATVDRAPGVSPRRMANAIRALAMDAVEAAKSGHPGMPMGMADAATVLFTRYLKFDPSERRIGPTGTGSCCPPATARCCFTRCSI